MGKWGLSDTIANEESFLSFGQLSFGVPDVGGTESQTQVDTAAVLVAVVCVLKCFIGNHAAQDIDNTSPSYLPTRCRYKRVRTLETAL